MDDDLRVSVLGQDPIDPIEDVEAVEPPHAHVVALTLAACAQVGREHVEAGIAVVPGHVQHIAALTGVAITASDEQRSTVVGGGCGYGR